MVAEMPLFPERFSRFLLFQKRHWKRAALTLSFFGVPCVVISLLSHFLLLSAPWLLCALSAWGR